jgi:photosystem II stability/assembly factor-like uncharacterized protein
MFRRLVLFCLMIASAACGSGGNDPSVLSAVAMLDVNTIVIGGGQGEIFTSVNGGNTFLAQDSGTTRDINGLKFLGSDLIGAVGDHGTFLLGSESGSLWLEQNTSNSENLNDFQFINNTTGVAVGERGVILRTFDGGANWTGLFLPAQISLNAVVFADTLTGWVAGGLGSVYKSTDGGQAWSLRSTGTQSLLFDLFLIDAQRIWAVGVGGAAIFSDDGGETWSSRAPGVPNANDLHRIFFQPDGLTGIVVGNEFAARTFDGGASWENITANLPALVDYLDMAVVGNTVVLVGEDETIARSDDFGTSFEFLSL